MIPPMCVSWSSIEVGCCVYWTTKDFGEVDEAEWWVGGKKKFVFTISSLNQWNQRTPRCKRGTSVLTHTTPFHETQFQSTWRLRFWRLRTCTNLPAIGCHSMQEDPHQPAAYRRPQFTSDAEPPGKVYSNYRVARWPRRLPQILLIWGS